VKAEDVVTPHQRTEEMVLLAEIRDLLKGLNMRQTITTGKHSLGVLFQNLN
jgi:hypothetical protein